jgi:hypothetical protein
MNLWFLELYHILCHLLKLRNTLGKDKIWGLFGNRIGNTLQNIWDVNICEVGTLGTYVGWEHSGTLGQTHERDTLKFLRTMETSFGEASSRTNFLKTTWRTNCERHWEHHGGTKVLNPTNFKVLPVPYQSPDGRWVLRRGGVTTIGGDGRVDIGQWNYILYCSGNKPKLRRGTALTHTKFIGGCFTITQVQRVHYKWHDNWNAARFLMQKVHKGCIMYHVAQEEKKILV